MPTLTQALDTFLQIDRAPTTNHNYRRILTLLVTAIGPERDVKRVSYEDLADYFYNLIRPIKRSTARTYLMVIQNFFAFCQRRGYVRRSPAADLLVRRGDEEPRQDRSIPPHELAAMVSMARHDSRHYAVLLFFISTGCRVGGIASLTLDNLDLDNQVARIREKGGEWERVFFGDETEAALRAWLAERPECDHRYVFTLGEAYGSRPMQYHNYRHLIRSLSRKIKAGRDYYPHAIRHSRGHALAKRGVELSTIAQLLNHKSADTTSRFYAPTHDEYVGLIARLYELASLEEAPTRREDNVLSLQPKRKSGGT